MQPIGRSRRLRWDEGQICHPWGTSEESETRNERVTAVHRERNERREIKNSVRSISAFRIFGVFRGPHQLAAERSLLNTREPTARVLGDSLLEANERFTQAAGIRAGLVVAKREFFVFEDQRADWGKYCSRSG